MKEPGRGNNMSPHLSSSPTWRKDFPALLYSTGRKQPPWNSCVTLHDRSMTTGCALQCAKHSAVMLVTSFVPHCALWRKFVPTRPKNVAQAFYECPRFRIVPRAAMCGTPSSAQGVYLKRPRYKQLSETRYQKRGIRRMVTT